MKTLTALLKDEVVIKRIQLFLIVLFAVLVVWDFFLALDCLDLNTISRVIQDRVDSGLLVLTYFWGAVCANLFFPKKAKPKINPTIGTIILYGIALIFVIINVEAKVQLLMSVDINNYGLGMIFGFIVGLVFWRQEFK